jgi:hypothetical protein
MKFKGHHHRKLRLVNQLAPPTAGCSFVSTSVTLGVSTQGKVSQPSCLSSSSCLVLRHAVILFPVAKRVMAFWSIPAHKNRIGKSTMRSLKLGLAKNPLGVC